MYFDDILKEATEKVDYFISLMKKLENSPFETWLCFVDTHGIAIKGLQDTWYLFSE